MGTSKLSNRRRLRPNLILLCVFLALSASIGMHSVLLHFITVDAPDKSQQIIDANDATIETPQLTPLWTCSDPNTINGRASKIVFVHIFKTAGMTMRELFSRYAVACKAGIGLVSECSGLSPMKSSLWMNDYGSKKGKPCLMKAIDRTRQSASLPNMHVEDSLLDQLDILAGHLPLMDGSVWGDAMSSDTKQTTIQYVVFFRNAIDKFVSGVMYQKKDQDYSFEAILELIQKRVKGELKQNKYREGYSAYLLTPQQKQQHYSGVKQQAHSTVEARTRQVLQNMDEHNILVGIVEQMSQSLELIQYLIDKDQEQTPLFQSFGMKTPSNAEEEEDILVPVAGKKNNPSKFSTASIVAELKKDLEFDDLLEEYVKYDDQIYKHALRMHNAQYQSFLQQRQRQ